MVKQNRFSAKQIKEYRDVLVKSGRNKISNIQVRTGLGYTDAKLLFGILNEDEKFVKDVLKYQKQLPIKINKFVSQVIKEIVKVKDKDYIDWDYITAKLDISYEFQREVLEKLKAQGHLADTRVHLINKK